MKKIIILLFLIVYNVYSQNNSYKIDEDIKIKSIDLSITNSVYKYDAKRLISVVLDRENDSVTYLSFRYGSKTKILDTTYFSDWKPKKNIQISSKIFDDIVSDLNELNIKKIEENWRVANFIHPNQYDLKFSDYTYTVYIAVIAPNHKTEKRGLIKFLAICRKIWALKNKKE